LIGLELAGVLHLLADRRPERVGPGADVPGAEGEAVRGGLGGRGGAHGASISSGPRGWFPGSPRGSPNREAPPTYRFPPAPGIPLAVDFRRLAASYIPGILVRSGASRAECRGRDRVPMRLWHLFVFIMVMGMVLAIARDPVGRIAMIVFVTALGEVVIGTTAILALFQTIGSLAEAVATTTLVLVLATAIMSSWLFAGAWLVQASLP